jgi:hypothetical protein
MRILQIIPRVPPPICGVADYSLNLARALGSQHGIETTFVSGAPPAHGIEKWGEFSLVGAARHRPGEFASQLLERPESEGLILHYSAYGFAKRGTPLWLALALLKLKKVRPAIPIVVMFHELGSRGTTWRSSSFWNWPVQQWIIRRLYEVASAAVTNRAAYAADLRRNSPDQLKSTSVLPVSSGFGEPAFLRPFSDRANFMAFFGWPMSAEKWKAVLPRLLRALDLSKASKLVVFRHPLPQDFDPGIPIVTHGILPPEEISAMLADCRFAFSDYDPAYLGKSSLFAAYCAHGLATFIHEGSGTLEDGIVVGQHVQGLFESTYPSESVASNAHTWYNMHNISRMGEHFANLIKTKAPEAVFKNRN